MGKAKSKVTNAKTRKSEMKDDDIENEEAGMNLKKLKGCPVPLVGCCIGTTPNDPDSDFLMECSNANCPFKGMPIHDKCMEMLEERLASLMKNKGSARDWTPRQLRSNVWDHKGLALIAKHCRCLCGAGTTKRDELVVYRRDLLRRAAEEQERQEQARLRQERLDIKAKAAEESARSLPCVKADAGLSVVRPPSAMTDQGGDESGWNIVNHHREREAKPNKNKEQKKRRGGRGRRHGKNRGRTCSEAASAVSDKSFSRKSECESLPSNSIPLGANCFIARPEDSMISKPSSDEYKVIRQVEVKFSAQKEVAAKSSKNQIAPPTCSTASRATPDKGLSSSSSTFTNLSGLNSSTFLSSPAGRDSELRYTSIIKSGSLSLANERGKHAGGDASDGRFNGQIVNHPEIQKLMSLKLDDGLPVRRQTSLAPNNDVFSTSLGFGNGPSSLLLAPATTTIREMKASWENSASNLIQQFKESTDDEYKNLYTQNYILRQMAHLLSEDSCKYCLSH